MPFRFALVRFAFHGGGLVSRHHTMGAAFRAQQKLVSKHCVCGCVGIVAIVPEDVGAEYYSPDCGDYYPITKCLDDLPEYTGSNPARSLAL